MEERDEEHSLSRPRCVPRDECDDGTELFGNTRKLANGTPARNGYEVLAELDTNGDGIVDARDAPFAELLQWEDRDRDGRSSLAELRSLTEVGITALHVDHQISRRTDEWGNRFLYRGKVDASVAPAERFSYDVFLTTDNLLSPSCAKKK